jgi:hypothetical protein
MRHDMAIVMFKPGELQQAHGRYGRVTGKPSDFYEWLGMHTDPHAYPPHRDVYPSFVTTDGTPAYEKMKMLLNDDWFFLLKVHLAKSG